MKKSITSFLSGVVLSILFGLIALVFDDATILLQLTGWSGAITLGLAMVFSGALLSGDRMRANTYSEQVDDRKTRINLSGIMLYLSVPNLIVFVVTYYLS
ncbi:MAG: hypothetical protein RLZZ267_269 [Bacillota bacterium]|jgi:hypothetical protein